MPASCRPPGDIEHGRKIGDSYKHGERVRYQCDLGYTRDGEHELICLDGTWNFDPPICRGRCKMCLKRAIKGNGRKKENYAMTKRQISFVTRCCHVITACDGRLSSSSSSYLSLPDGFLE